MVGKAIAELNSYMGERVTTGYLRSLLTLDTQASPFHSLAPYLITMSSVLQWRPTFDGFFEAHGF